MQYLKHRWNTESGYREVLAVAIPLILSTASWSVQHFVDRMFLAWYSPETIAAAMPAGMLNFSMVSIFMGTAGYVSTFVAQYYGAKRFHRIGPALWQGVYMSLIGGLLILIARCISVVMAIATGLGLYAAAFLLLLAAYRSGLAGGAAPLVLGFPASTAVMLYLLWPVPLWFLWLYLRHFDEQVLSADDVERVRRIAREVAAEEGRD